MHLQFGVGSYRLASSLRREFFQSLRPIPWLLLFANLLFGLILAFRPGSPFVMKAIGDVGQCLIPLAGAAWCAWACHSRSNRPLLPKQKAALCCFYLGQVCFAAGMGLWIYYEVFRHQEVPFPSWADAAFLVVYPLLLAGNLLVPVRPIPPAARVKGLLDILLVMTAMVTFSWYFVLGPNLLNEHQSLLMRFLSMGYPAGDLLVMVSLLIFTTRDAGREFQSGIFLCSAGLAVLIVVDSVFGYMTLRGLYQSGTLLDVLWPLGYTLLAWGVIRIRQAFGTAPVAPRNNAVAPSVLWRSLLPYLLIPAVAVLVIFVGTQQGDQRLCLGVYLGSALLVGLLLLRQFLAISENHHLNVELSAARDAVEAASRTKSEFLANMSHELRTPLNAIIGYSEMLREDAEASGNAESLPDLNKIHSAGKHLLGVISDILDLSKIEAGKMELHLEAVSIPDLVSNLAETVRPLVEKNGNSFTVHCPRDAGVIQTDATKVRQGLFNLLSNAGKFTREGSVRLEVCRDGQSLAFTVSDTGIGISPQQQEQLFQAFVQADSSTTRKYGGTGLGLTVTRRFAQMLGGKVAVVSAEGRGSTFTLQIPANVPSQQEPKEPLVEAVSPLSQDSQEAVRPLGIASPSTRGTLLVIDDDPDVRELLRRFLEKEGYEVAAAPGGDEGLQLARELSPSAITLDVKMPGLNGWLVLAALKLDPELAHIPVIMLTTAEGRNQALALGAVEYLPKPLDRNRLLEILGRWQVSDQADRSRTR